jgi:hypothetical protein
MTSSRSALTASFANALSCGHERLRTVLPDRPGGPDPHRALDAAGAARARGSRSLPLRGALPALGAEWSKEVADALDLDVTGGEQDCELPTWRCMIAMRAVDVVQPDVCYLGGLTRTLRVAAMAQAAGLPVTPHSANLSLVTVCTLYMMGAIAGAGPCVEFSIEGADYYPWQDGIFASALAVRDGKVRIRTGRAGESRSNRHGWPARPIRAATSADDAWPLRMPLRACLISVTNLRPA